VASTARVAPITVKGAVFYNDIMHDICVVDYYDVNDAKGCGEERGRNCHGVYKGYLSG
jgi:hypothetical protein